MLVIVDMTMPKLNGEETVRAPRLVRSDVPVILTSGYNEIEATRRFKSKGLAGFLEKPFSTADLMREWQSVLANKCVPKRASRMRSTSAPTERQAGAAVILLLRGE